MRGWLTTTLAVGALLAGSGVARAQVGLRVLEAERIRVDGAAREWQGAHWIDVGRGRDASMRVALAHDAQALYVVAQVRDDRLVRTQSPGAREDAVILTLSSPGRGGARDVYLFAGVSGRSAATAAIAPVGRERLSRARGIQVVEGPLEGGRGYTLEARVPFAAFPGGARSWDEHRASIRLRDVDSEAHPDVEAEPSFVPVDPAHLDRLVPLRPTGGASGALEAFLAARNFGAARPTHQLRGNVIGDRQEERVYLVHGFIVVAGPGVQSGGYAYHELPVDDARDVRSAQLRDLTGDGVRELVLVIRQRNAQGERDLWQVFSLESPIRALFAIEVRKAFGGGSVESRVRVLRARRGAPEIEVRAHRAEGLDRDSYRERPADDAQPMLLPWGRIRARRYRWNGRAFSQTREEENPRYEEPAASPAPGRAEPAAPPPAPDADALLTAFRRERRIRRGARPRFRGRVNLAGDRAPERFEVYGRELVAVGPGIQGGSSWMYYRVPVDADEDVVDVSAADVTGDGRAEILMRVTQHFGEVRRELLLVHQLTDRGFPQLLQVEVARRRGNEAVENQIQARGGRLQIAPGRARGFSGSNWPFTRDASDSAEPLLLPWSDRPVRYRFQGGRLRR